MLLTTTILCAALALLASSPASASTTLAKLRHARHDLRLARHHLLQYRAQLRAVLESQTVTTVRSDGQTTSGVAVSPSPAAQVSPPSDPSPSPSQVPTPSPDASASATPDPAPSATAGPSTDPAVGTADILPITSLTPDELRAKIAQTKAWVVRLGRRVGRLEHRLFVDRATARGYYVPLIRDVSRLSGVSAAGLQAMMKLESGGRATAVGGGGAYLGLYQYSLGTWRAAWNPWKACSIYDPAAQIRATARAVHLGYGPSMWPNTYWRSF